MKYRVDNLDVHYEEFGSGRPVFMLHGWTLDHHAMLQHERLFAARSGWRRIYPDLPGMGRTRGPDWVANQDDVLDIVLAFIDALAPRQRFSLIGTSYGGYLARGVAYRRSAQMDGMALLVPSIKPNWDGQPPFRPLIVQSEFAAALEPREQWLSELLVVQTLDVLAVMRGLLHDRVPADMAFLERLRNKYEFSFAVDSLIAPFPAPVLFVTGRFDWACGYQEAFAILGNYPRATYAVLDRAGHAIGAEQPALRDALLDEWLSRVEEYAAAQDSAAAG